MSELTNIIEMIETIESINIIRREAKKQPARTNWCLYLQIPVLYVLPSESISGKLLVVPVSDTGTVPAQLVFWRCRYLQTRFRKWLPDAVCEFFGMWVVP